MSWNNMVRSAAVAGLSLALALGLTACSRDYNVAYVYAISASNNTVSAYAVDYQTGILNQIAGSPFQSTVSDPIQVVAAPNSKFIYVVGGPIGSQGNQVEEYAVGTDGKIYGQHTYNLTGTYPTGAAIDTTGTFLYVTFQYQIGYTPASPGPGGVTIFPINSDNSLGTPTTLNVGNHPVGIALSKPVCVATPLVSGNGSCTGLATGGTGTYNVYAYVLDQETLNGVASGASPSILGFAQNMTTGALTPLPGTSLTTNQGYAAGVVPSAIAVEGTARFVYVTDQEANEVIGYSIARSTTGDLTPLSGSPYGTGAYPVSLTVDPRADYVYTANRNSGSISSFAISQATGNLSTVGGSTFTGEAGTTCVTIEPALGIFLYTTNLVAGDISGGELNPNTGVVSAVENSPFSTSALPSCLVSVANGEHAISVLSP